MYGVWHINRTWESKEVGRLKLLYECVKPQSRGPSFVGGELTPRHRDILLSQLTVVQGKKLKKK